MEGKGCQHTVQAVQVSIQSPADEIRMVLETIHPAPITGLPLVIQVLQGLQVLQILDREAPTHQDHLPIHQDHLPGLLQDLLLIAHLAHHPAEDRSATGKCNSIISF